MKRRTLLSGIAAGLAMITRDYAALEENLVALSRLNPADLRVQLSLALVRLRAQTGCRVFLLLEGAPWPRGTIGRMDAAHLRAIVASMQVRHAIQVVQAADEAGSAARLQELAAAFARALRDDVKAQVLALEGPVDKQIKDMEAAREVERIRKARTNALLAKSRQQPWTPEEQSQFLLLQQRFLRAVQQKRAGVS